MTGFAPAEKWHQLQFLYGGIMQYKVEKHMTHFYGIEQIFILFRFFWWTKNYFYILDNLYQSFFIF